MQRPMSLNGYAWVEGNPVMHTDPSGMIMESPATWDACFVQPGEQPVPSSSSTTTSILGAAVFIEMGFMCLPLGNKCNCVHPVKQITIGTLTTDGLWTHDHIARIDLNNPESSTFANNADEALTNMRSHDCIEFKGAVGTFATTGYSLDAQIISRVNGAMKLQIGFGGIGIPVQEGQLISKANFQNSVDVVHIRGDNRRCASRREIDGVMGGSHICGHESLATTTLTPIRYGLLPSGQNRSGYFLTDENNRLEPGDSGAGIFQDGFLVAVFIGGRPDTEERHAVPVK
jgi:hypothetical protein